MRRLKLHQFKMMRPSKRLKKSMRRKLLTFFLKARSPKNQQKASKLPPEKSKILILQSLLKRLLKHKNLPTKNLPPKL